MPYYYPSYYPPPPSALPTDDSLSSLAQEKLTLADTKAQ